MDTEYRRCLDHADRDPSVRVIVVTGSGERFSVGGDSQALESHAEKGTYDNGIDAEPATPGYGVRAEFDQPFACHYGLTKPVIAAVNGAAFAGGLGLVGASDIVITSNEALFSFSEVRIGVIPAIIAVPCLRKLGPHQGVRLFVTGDRFTGDQAVEYGLAHKSVPPEQLMETVRAEIDMINQGGPIAVVECKKLVRRVLEVDMAEGFDLTAGWSRRMFQSEEAAEGMSAFREKRKASWVPSGEAEES